MFIAHARLQNSGLVFKKGNRCYEYFVPISSPNGTQDQLPRFRSLIISLLAFNPGAPVTPPPGCVPAPHKYKPLMGVR